MSMYSKHKMFCTICGGEYYWNCNFGFSKSRTCSKECNNEWNWIETLSILGKEYYPMPTEDKEMHKKVELNKISARLDNHC